ncbi:hypothetical protein EZS27_035834, partial [termite gut metagenome]
FNSNCCLKERLNAKERCEGIGVFFTTKITFFIYIHDIMAGGTPKWSNPNEREVRLRRS